MKKSLMLLLCILMTACLLTGCGASESDALCQKWKLVEFTVNGNRSVIDDSWAATLKDAPRFECDEDGNFTLYNLSKGHPGTVKKTGENTYNLEFSDKTKPMEAVIDGDRLTISTSDNGLIVIFEVDK